MTLTYVFHSCFVLDAEKSILIFDYWLDPGNVVPKFFDKRSGKADDLQKDKPLYVFSSHFHEDHFNRKSTLSLMKPHVSENLATSAPSRITTPNTSSQ